MIDIDLWSLADFISIKNGNFNRNINTLIRKCEEHIFICEVTQLQFIKSKNYLIFKTFIYIFYIYSYVWHVVLYANYVHVNK